MKSWLFLLVVSVALYPTYESNGNFINDPSPLPATVLPDSINFTADIQPILVKRCSPCHFTGGKMYEKLPFDKAETILKPEVKEGLLKRIKEEKENNAIRMFIEKNGTALQNEP